MLSDYHIHTSLCKHAEGDAADFLNAANELGMDEICFTDHAPAPDGYDRIHRMALSEFRAYEEMVRSLIDARPTRVLFGIEADYYEGCRAFLEPWLSGQPFDLVLGSVHFIENWGFDNPEERSVWDSADVTGTWRKYFDLIGKLAETRLFDVVAHLDLPKKFGHRPGDRDLREMAMPALDKIAKAEMAIEINTSGLLKPVNEIYPSRMLLELARERGIPICFGSDAHLPEHVGHGFEEAVRTALDAGYTQAVRFLERRQIPHGIAE